jgi:predicted nucleic acid-binding protein
MAVSFLLDTNVLDELRRARRGNQSVAAWVESVPRNLQFISVITLLEVEQGVFAKERRDPVQGTKLRIWLDSVVRPNFSGRVLPVTETIALRCARLHVPDNKPKHDALVAATALVHNLVVVTNDTDFDGMGAPLFNPWKAARQAP